MDTAFSVIVQPVVEPMEHYTALVTINTGVAIQIDLICHLQMCRYVLSEVVVVVVCSWTQAVDGCNSLWNAAEFQERKKLAIALTAAWSLAAARRDLLYQQVRGPWGDILIKYCVDI